MIVLLKRFSIDMIVPDARAFALVGTERINFK